ncbi:hypothetical protein RJ639_046209 [Escallonia herrerae]|uniref:C3H1-type domain-containing protein n=1 Tax=Escallonia herrerae TaxID=1293975 RepID=A0AA89AYS2_9ASTE|nr:hypothetical protein RJ639_046209 [Escallonia herrerae]
MKISGRPIIVDFSPVTDFREATCRQYEENVCNRGGYCNFMHLKKISRELRRQLFGRNRRGRRSRSRSRSPQRHRNYDDRPHGGRGFGRRGDYGDHRNHERGRRPRSRSPGWRGGRSRSPGGRRNKSPDREGSAERRAKIEQWNREKEQEETGNKNDNGKINNDSNSDGGAQDEEDYNDPQQQQDHGGSGIPAFQDRDSFSITAYHDFVYRMAQELSEFVARRLKGTDPLASVDTDKSKAYISIRRDVLETTIRATGFPSQWIQFLSAMRFDRLYSCYINGSTDHFCCSNMVQDREIISCSVYTLC